MSHIVITIQLVGEGGEVKGVREVGLGEIELPGEGENVLDMLEWDGIRAGKRVAQALIEMEWENKYAMAEARSFSPSGGDIGWEEEAQGLHS